MVPTDPTGELRDSVLDQEITLLGELIDAVASAGHSLTTPELDRVLGLVRPDTGRHGRTPT
jgi:hypothetical protein